MRSISTEDSSFIKRALVRAAAGLMAGALSLACAAQDWKPRKPITIIVPVAPGSSNDLIARILAERLPARLGQAVVVENRPGAGGMIGVGMLARAEADGHTIGVAPSNIYIAPHLQAKGAPAVDVLGRLAPILTAGSAPVLVIAHPSAKVTSPQELVAYLRRAGGVSYATSGTGSPMHLAAELFKRATRTDLTHVPYKGVMPAANAVLAGEVPIGFSALGGIAPFLSSGQLVPVALAEAQRSKLLPHLPTLTEAGIPGVELGVYFQLLAPAGTPAPAMARLNAEANAVLRAADVRERLRAAGVEAMGGSAAEAAQRARDDHARYGRLIRQFGITAE
jgi:tripartite-type tricarboxylate transporter receptor subunit TctC